ncbi:hypothetical protein CaCOL14_008349 [Colletotrichum acutatum]
MSAPTPENNPSCASVVGGNQASKFSDDNETRVSAETNWERARGRGLRSRSPI